MDITKNALFPNQLVPNMYKITPLLRPIHITKGTDNGSQQTAECDIKFGEDIQVGLEGRREGRNEE